MFLNAASHSARCFRANSWHNIRCSIHRCLSARSIICTETDLSDSYGSMGPWSPGAIPRRWEMATDQETRSSMPCPEPSGLSGALDALVRCQSSVNSAPVMKCNEFSGLESTFSENVAKPYCTRKPNEISASEHVTLAAWPTHGQYSCL